MMGITYWRCYLSLLPFYLYMICFGMMAIYTSPALPDINRGHYGFYLTTYMQSWLTSLAPLFAIPGSFIMVPIMDIFGRKFALVMTTFPMAVSWLIIICSRSVAPFAIGQVIAGLCLGMIGTCNGVYVSELAPQQIRGKLNILMFLGFGIGEFFTNIIASRLDWQWLAVISLALVALTSITSLSLHESPRWLVSKGYRKAAAKVIESAWQIRDPKIISEQIDDIAAATAHTTSSSNKNCFKNVLELFKPPLWKPLLLTQSLITCQVFTEISYIIAYTISIFVEAAGSTNNSRSFLLVPLYQSCLIFLACILGNLGSLFIIDRIGRRKLLIATNILACFSLACIGTYYFVASVHPAFAARHLFWIPLTSLLVLGCSINSCFAIFPQLLISELFDIKVRALASAIASVNHNLTLFIILKFFPLLGLFIYNYGIFWIFAAFTLASVILVILWVPETKGQSLEQIHKKWHSTSVENRNSRVEISHL